MAIFHLKADIICRSHGRSVVAAAAYRAGQRIRDDRQGVVFDFTRRKHVAWTEILSPSNSPEFFFDRCKLWNHVETQESRKDSQLAREILIALPHELRPDQQIELVKKYVRKEFTSRGLVVDACIHNNPTNCHAHLLVSMRKIEGTGFGAKCRELNGRDYLKNLRERWARTVNLFLMTKGHKERIDHRKKADVLIASNESLKQEELHMTIENNNQQKVLKRTTRSPLTSLAAPSLMAAHNESSNSIICVGAQLPPELYDHMQIALIEMMRAIFGAEVTVQFDSQSKKYVGYFEGKQRIEITKDRITCGTGADDEIALAIEAAIQFGWKRIRLNGSDDFKRRAYAEAIRRGYGAGDIDGYTPLTISCTPTATSSLPNSSGAKIPAPSRRSQF